MPASKDALASHADVLRGFVTRSCPTSEAGTRDEPLRTSAWEARDAPLAPAYRRALFFSRPGWETGHFDTKSFP